MEAVPVEVVNKYILKRIKVTFEKETTYGDKISVSATVREINDDNLLKSYHNIRNSEGAELTLLEADWEKIDK